jgi:hypothetical protein
VRQIGYPSSTQTSSILSLLQISLDGSMTVTQLSSSDSANLFPGTLMPDGNGGILATWTIVPSNPNAPPVPNPYQEADVIPGAGVVNTYNLPGAPTQVTNGSNGLPINPTLVLGENGTAFASYGSNVVAFNIAGGSAIWSYQAPSQTGISLITLTPSNGLATKNTSQSAPDTLISFDSSGNATATPSIGTSLTYSWQGDWHAFSNGLMASITLPFMPVDTVSSWAQPSGNTSTVAMATVHHSFGLFWCGTGYGLQG